MFQLETVEALGDLTVADITNTAVTSVTSDVSMLDIIRLFRDHNYEGIPVVDNGYLSGMAMRQELLNLYFIPNRDLDKRDPRKLLQLVSLMDVEQPVAGFMNRDPLTVFPDCKISRLALLMVENDIYTIPVVKEKKGFFLREKKNFIGIVTLTDMMPLLYEALCCEQ